MTRWWQVGLVGLVVVALAVVLPAAGVAQSPVVVRAAMSGQVLPLRLATAGQMVKRGDPLVFVQTRTSPTTTGGAVPAAVATVDGQVTQVMVGPGDFVNIGDAVVVITPH
ncbi:MAG TPA: hypothetical protein VEZ44_09315 [bacterium]|nr:hypothetical protein [bacterium]